MRGRMPHPTAGSAALQQCGAGVTRADSAEAPPTPWPLGALPANAGVREGHTRNEGAPGKANICIPLCRRDLRLLPVESKSNIVFIAPAARWWGGPVYGVTFCLLPNQDASQYPAACG